MYRSILSMGLMMALSGWSLGASAAPWGAPGFSQERQVILQMRGTEYDASRRGAEYIDLKRELWRQHPHLNPNFLDLVSVEMVAKSRHGRAVGSLYVGSREVDRQRIPGRNRDFNSNHPRSFYLIDLRNHNFDSRGDWVLEIRGQVRIREIVLNLREQSRPPVQRPDRPGQRPDRPDRPGQRPERPDRPGERPGAGPIAPFQLVAEARFQRVSNDSQIHRVNIRNARYVRFTSPADGGPVTLQRMVVTYRDGRTEEVAALVGDYGRGQSRQASLRGGDIQSIRVWGMTPLIVGPTSRYQIEVAAALPRR